MSIIEEKVCSAILSRSKKGLYKYGVSMERDDLSRLEWLKHAQEEAMDLAVYLQKLIEIELHETDIPSRCVCGGLQSDEEGDILDRSF